MQNRKFDFLPTFLICNLDYTFQSFIKGFFDLFSIYSELMLKKHVFRNSLSVKY